MDLKQEKQELYNFIDELHHNRDSYSRAKLLEMVKDKIKETIPNTILSEHNDNIDTSDSNCIIPDVVGRSEQLICPRCGSNVIVSDERYNIVMCGVCKYQWETNCLQRSCNMKSAKTRDKLKTKY